MNTDRPTPHHLSGTAWTRRVADALAALSLSTLLGANAQAQTWNGAGGDAFWSNPANWTAIPGTGSDIYFGISSQTTTTNDLTDNLVYSGIIFNSGAPGYTLNGNPITLNGGEVGYSTLIQNDGTSPQTMNMDVILPNAAFAYRLALAGVATGGTVTINGVISGPGQLYKQNNLAFTLNGANTFTGPVLITANQLNIASIKNVGGAPNSLGQPTLANSLLQLGTSGQDKVGLTYLGTGDTSDRNININTATLANGIQLVQSGTGLWKMTGGLSSTSTAGAQRRLYLDGTSTGIGEIAGAISNGVSTGVQIQKNGSGTWRLSGINTTTSATTINGGKLVGVTGGSSSTSACTVTASVGATAGVRVLTTGGTWTQSAYTFNAGTSAEFDFGAGVLPSTTIAPMQTVGNVTLNATTAFVIKAGNLPVGDYPLVKASGTLTGTPSSTLTLPPRVAANLVTTTGAGGGVNLVVTAGTQGIIWAAGSGTWDLNATSNWNLSGGGATTYQELNGNGDAVLFDASPAGDGPFAVTLDSAVTPIGVTVNSTKDYAISGAGGIAGSGNLTKLGAGTLTLNTTNTYTGDTRVGAGTLALGGTGAINATGNLTIAGGATFDVSAISSYSLPAGAGLAAIGTDTAAAIIKGDTTVSLGSRQVALTFTPASFSGDTTHPALVISQGALALGGNGVSVNNAGGTALGMGVYRLIQVGDGSSGTITGAPTTFALTVTGAGLAPDTQALLAVSDGNVDLVVSIPTTVTLNSSSPATTYGDEVTFTATVAATTLPSTGTVQFYDNGIALGDPATVTDGTASYATPYLAAHSHPITASYTGGDGYAPSSTSASFNQSVSKKALTITLQPQTKGYGNLLYANSDGTAREEHWDGTNWITINTGTSWVADGLVNGELLTNAYVGLAAPIGGSATQPVGTYTNGVFTDAGVATFTGTNGFLNTNYSFIRIPADYTVTPAPLTITATAREKFFGESLTLGTSAFVVTPGQLMNGQTVTAVTLTATSGPPDGTAPADPVGLYAITPSAALGGNGFDVLNYNITYAVGVLTVKESAYATWKTLYFGANANDPEIAGDLVDFDADGIPNLLEFALSGDPTIASSEILPTGDTAIGYLQISFTRPAPADVSYVVQASSGLDSWTDIATLGTNGTTWTGAAVVTETGTGSTRAVSVRDTATVAGEPHRFLRLWITR